MNITNQRICIHMMIPFVLCTLVGLFVLPGWLPPPSPDLPPDALDAMFRHHLSMRVGVELLAVTASFFLGPTAAWAAQLRRYEGRHHVMADLQLMCGVIGTVVIILACYFWLAISYRGDTPHAVIAVFDDLSWFLIIGGVGSGILQCIPFAICILGDEQGLGIYPRWLGYLNIWFAILLLPGAMIPFFQTGPFTWRGALGFWVVVTAFFLWAALNYIFTVIAIDKQARDPARDIRAEEVRSGG